MSERHTPVVGFIGGVGSGKSSLTKWISEKLNAAVISADEAGHRALEQPEVKERIREHFGPGVFDDADTIVRSRLATRVFGSDEPQQAARRQLEQIVHPEIRRDLERQIAVAGQSSDLILLDAAVMLESGWRDACDAVVYVDVPLEVRRERVQRTRRWSAEVLASREASQWPLDVKRAAADVSIDNSDSLERAGQQFLNWYETWSRSHPHGGDKRRMN
ncbi:MAG: dephospho-CoA kinase [Planctomycetaceae bacterium]|nr:dephospho-CoA kinase [Planctomycetaceae bacterium]